MTGEPELAGQTTINDHLIIGDAGAAQLLEQEGHPRLAEIHRLTGPQAVSVLSYLTGAAPDLVLKALEHMREYG